MKGSRDREPFCVNGIILRDARINQIGEGSNEVLTSFIALVGMRGPGMEFKENLRHHAETSRWPDW
jgi:hypothetical protein